VSDAAELRGRRLLWAAGCLALVALLAVLVVTGWQPLQRLDTRVGTGPETFTYGHAWATRVFVWIGRITGTWPQTGVTAVVAVTLFVRGHRRAAYWTVGVMATAALVNTAAKLLIHRNRPVWRHPVEVLKTFSFPSGHSSGIASAAGVAIVLTLMLVRRRSVRRILVSAALGVAVLVGLDRIFLGVHNVSDVVAGWSLGTAAVLVGLAVYDPTPRSLADRHDPLPEVLVGADRQLAVVLNPAKIEEPEGFRLLVEHTAKTSGWSAVRWWETTVDDTGYQMAHEAAVSGADLVVAVGGDGTIRAVCEELAGTGIPVGIVPAGTGNLLARNLGIPLYLRAAVDVAINGQDRAIDMVEVSGDKLDDAVFLVMAGMGFDAAIMEGVDEGFKQKVGWLAYVWSALKSLMFPAIRVEISVDEAPFTVHRARTIVIGNVGLLQGGMPLIPDAAIDDGRLDLVLLYPQRFLSWLPLAVRVLSRSPRTDETITRMCGRSVVVRSATEAPRQLDGDLVAPGREIRATCLHGRLLVRVPR
jgi:YegS/Rv2252/BmrU family lipid kinase